MNNVHLPSELIDSLSDLVGASENESAVEMIDAYMIENHYSVIVVDYSIFSRYAPRGYGEVASYDINLDDDPMKQRVFSYFLCNLAHAKVYFF